MSQSPFGPAPLGDPGIFRREPPFTGDPGIFRREAPFTGDPGIFREPLPPAVAAAPSFGQPVGTPPFVPPPPPMLPQQTHQGAPNFLSAAMPILAAVLAGGKDPRAIGEGLAAFQRGRQLKLAEQEHQQDRDLRTRTEQAEFYSRALEQAGTFDDPVAFEQWRSAIAPVAELHGINPAVFTFSDSKRQAKAKKDAQAVIDTMRKVHGAVVDDPAWQEAHTTELNGQPVKVSDVYRLAQLPSVRDQSGVLTAPTRSADNAQRMEVVVNGKRTFGFFDPKTRRITDASGKDITAIAQPPSSDPIDKPAATGSFEDYLARYAKTRNKKVDALTDADIEDARKRYQQADDKAGSAPRARFTVQQVTKPDGSTGLVRVNMDTGDVSPVSLPDGAGAGHASDTQRLSKAYLDRTVASDKTAATFEASLAKLGSQVDVQLPNLLKSEAGQQYKQAEDEFINAALRRESGAAIQPSEYERFEKIYFVRPGDTPTTIAQKQEARRRVVEGFRVAAGSLGQQPGGGAKPKVTITSIREIGK